MDGMKIGMNVRKGDVICFVCDTGFATGPHLDFRFSKNGKLVDYRKIALPDGQPVDITCLDEFDNYVNQIKVNLEENT